VPVAQVRDLKLYYEIHGTGRPVVLISGTGADLRQNRARGRGLLEQNFQVLMYDQRGLGRTSKPDQRYTMADYADDFVALLEVVGWERADVVGVSFGGMVAQHVALTYPDRVNRLVLACTSAGGAGGASFDLMSVFGMETEARNQIVLPIMDSRNDLSTDPWTLAPMFDVLLPIAYAGKPPLNADDPAWATGARRQLEARAEHDVWDQLPAIQAETFVIGGRYDQQAPPENVTRLAEQIPGATLQFFEGGHLFLLQERSAWRAIVDFLQ
jgi:3-oxoadipate enol-lactonase